MKRGKRSRSPTCGGAGAIANICTDKVEDDPFSCAPNQYNERVFQANNPLVRICDIRKHEHLQRRCDKFVGHRMDLQALRTIMRRCRRPTYDAFHLHGECHKEEEGAGIHMALFQGIQRCMRPKRTRLLEVQELKASERDDEIEGHVGFLVRAAAQASEEDDNAISSQGSNSSGKSNNEAGYADYLAIVEDHGPSRQHLQKFDPEKVVMVVERKWNKNLKAANGKFQGGHYAVAEAQRNVLRGHSSPIYILVLCENLWTYGKLELEGWIRIKGGHIDPNSMPEYEEIAAFMGVQPRGLADLQKELDDGIVFLQDNYQMSYPDGLQMVGNIFFSDVWYSLPSARPQQFLTDGAERFFEGVCRVIRGDAILKWKSQQVLEALKYYEHFMELVELVSE